MIDTISRPEFDAIQRRIVSGDVGSLVSPGFLVPPPEVMHPERIPPAVLSQMRPTWERVWFPPRPLHFTIVEDVFVAQDGLVLRRDGSVIPETITQHAVTEVRAAQTALWAMSSEDYPKITGSVALCRKPGTGIYGHWLVELLPVAYFASQLPDPSRFLIQALDHGPMPALIRQTLSSLGINENAIVYAGRDPVWVERLIIIHGLTEHGGYISPVAVECLQTIADRIAPAGPEAIFIIRPPGSGRNLVDEPRIVKQAEAAGFTVLDPATMSFRAQVAAFKAARRIVGVMGSALANLAFAPEGAQVFILAPATMPDAFFWLLSHHRKLNMQEIRCNPVSNKEPDWFSTDLELDRDDSLLVFDRLSIPFKREDPLFDPQFYLDHNPDIRTESRDLLSHYMEIGWKQGRLPSERFDGNRYLNAYEDVRAAGINPLLHFLKYGRKEGRNAFGRM